MVVELFREVVITNACIAWSQIDDELINLFIFSKSRPNIKLTGSVLLSLSFFFFLILYFLLSVSVYRGTENKWWSYCEWGSFRLHSCIKALETHFSFLISLLILFHFFLNPIQSFPCLPSVPAARHNFPISYFTFSSTFVFSVYLILKCM